jgi:hypothetical protein
VAQVKAQSDAQKAAAATAQAAAQGDKAAIVDMTAKALVERIGRTTTDSAGALLFSEYKLKLSAATTQAQLETATQQIAAQQDQAQAFATPTGTTNTLTDGSGLKAMLPWALGAGLLFFALKSRQQ